MRKPHKALLLFLFLVLYPLPSFAVVVGPFSGTVVDSRTGDPVDGASVLMYWIKAVPGSFEGPRYVPIKTALVYADREGKYNFPKFNADVGLQGVFESTHMLIYQPGYEVYIMDVCHAGPYCKKNDLFKEKDNMAKLDRIPPGFNHKEHFEKIENAARVSSYDYFPEHNSLLTWKHNVDFNVLIVPDVKEFLRRAEWEDRRGAKQ